MLGSARSRATASATKPPQLGRGVVELLADPTREDDLVGQARPQPPPKGGSPTGHPGRSGRAARRSRPPALATGWREAGLVADSLMPVAYRPESQQRRTGVGAQPGKPTASWSTIQPVAAGVLVRVVCVPSSCDRSVMRWPGTGSSSRPVCPLPAGDRPRSPTRRCQLWRSTVTWMVAASAGWGSSSGDQPLASTSAAARCRASRRRPTPRWSRTGASRRILATAAALFAQ